MLILSISDLITNSSSEVFCTITADNNEILKEIYSTLEDLGESDYGEGGVWLEDKYVGISFDRDVFSLGVEEILKAGIEKLLEPWKNKYKIDYDNY